MVVLNRIYTRTGDDGTTALGGGERRHKYDLRIAAYGSVDELNAVIGVARLHTGTDPDVDAILARIQNDLFDVGAEGSLDKRRVFAQFDDCYPDGICLDAEGAIWVADARGNRVIRVFEGGRIERTISTGEQGAFACMLGGPDRRTLFICTSSGTGPVMASKRDGRIEFARADVPGAGLP